MCLRSRMMIDDAHRRGCRSILGHPGSADHIDEEELVPPHILHRRPGRFIVGSHRMNAHLVLPVIRPPEEVGRPQAINAVAVRNNVKNGLRGITGRGCDLFFGIGVFGRHFDRNNMDNNGCLCHNCSSCASSFDALPDFNFFRSDLLRRAGRWLHQQCAAEAQASRSHLT